MQPTRTKKEWEEEFKKTYICILKRLKSYDDLIIENEENLNAFKSEHTLDNNSIEFLPAYFNFIECFLAQDKKKLSEVKKYLIVGLTNLLNASKKGDDKNLEDRKSNEYEPEEVNRKLLQSRLDLLFGRFNLKSDAPPEQTIDKLNSSIIIYSEIYGPENVGLTPQYFYLAEYFLVTVFKDQNKEMNKKIIVKKIYSKIAELWRQYFADVVNPLFLYNDDTPLLLAIGETYVKLISNKIATEFPRNSESELDLKFKMIKVVILKKTKSDLYQQALNNVLDQQKKVESQILDKEYFEDMNEFMKNDEED
jgi:hypothetical protein